MVVPSPTLYMLSQPLPVAGAGHMSARMDQKQHLRVQLRRTRREYVASLPSATRALLFMRPPAAVAAMVGEGKIVGLYHATRDEAPTAAYARWFHENGRQVALPWFASKAAPMRFRLWASPWDSDTLEADPHGARQPMAGAEVVPDVVFVPLVGFTGDGARLGQGGGHYDRWLAAHDVPAIGMAWDCQIQDSLPTEPHDRALMAVITPTRLYGQLA